MNVYFPGETEHNSVWLRLTNSDGRLSCSKTAADITFLHPETEAIAEFSVVLLHLLQSSFFNKSFAN